MEQLTRPFPLVANRLLGPETARRPIPILVKIPETVESAIPSTSAISAAVKRNRRSFVIASTRSGAVRLATRRGTDERSNKPGSPSIR